MKNSIAKKLTFRVAILMLVALAVLFGVSYDFISNLVYTESDHYAKAIVAIYADMTAYEAEGVHIPLDISYGKEAEFYGDYICSWYRVDYIYMYVPNIEDGTITYISVSKKKEKFGESAKESMIGKTKKYTLSKDELAVWNGEQVYATVKNNDFEKALDTVMMVKDTFGNKVMVGAAVSNDDIKQEIQREFLKAAAMILIVFSVLIPLMYLLIQRRISRPAQRICRSMTEFIADGKRSDVRLYENGNDEFAMIADSFNSMTGDIDNYLENIRILSREQEHQKTEMDVAANIQKGFLPPEEMNFENCEICAMMKPAKDVGGDLYDYLKIDETHTLVVIADISGKGIAAAMLMAVTLMLIRQFAKMGQNPALILQNVNDMLSERNPRMLFATAFVAIYDSDTNTLTYANAGHNLPYILDDRVTVLNGAQNTLLGLFPNEEYTEESIQLKNGDVLFLYTDGVNETVNENGGFYGTERLEKVLKSAKSLHIKNIVKTVSDSVGQFAGEAEPHDDITMLSFMPKEKHELTLDVDLREFSKIKEVILASKLPRSLQLELCVAAEECFVNICSYAFGDSVSDGEKITFSIEHSDRIVMRFVDGGAQYDPRENVIDNEDYDIDLQVGGLGKLIAFTVADAVDYEYTDGKNILTITKNIKEN